MNSPDRVDGRGGAVRGVRFPAALAVIATVWIGVLETRNVYLNHLSRSWPQVAGVITWSESNSLHGWGVEYRYSIQGRTLSSTRVSYLTEESIPEMREVAPRYATGDAVQVKVNPRDPAMSVLETRPLSLRFFDTELLLAAGLWLATAVSHHHGRARRE